MLTWETRDTNRSNLFREDTEIQMNSRTKLACGYIQILWYYKFTKFISEGSDICIRVSDNTSLKADIGEKVKQTFPIECKDNRR